MGITNGLDRVSEIEQYLHSFYSRHSVVFPSHIKLRYV